MEYFTHKEDINDVGKLIIAADGEGGSRPLSMKLHCGLVENLV